MLRLLEKVLHFHNKCYICTQYMCSSTRHLHFLKKLSIYTLKFCISPQETFHLYTKVLHFSTRNCVLAFKNAVLSQKKMHSHDKLYIGWQKLCIYPSDAFFVCKMSRHQWETHTSYRPVVTDSCVFLSVFVRRHCIMKKEKHYTNAFEQLICDSVLERSSFLE